MENETDRAAILEIHRATGQSRIFASGLRNPNGLAWQRESGELCTVVNERDLLGSDLIPDYLTSVKDGSALLLLAYAIWPVTGFFRIASAVEAKDAAALQVLTAERLADLVVLRIRPRRLLRVYLPPDKSPDQQFKAKLSLRDLQWNLTGIDPPKPVLVQLAQELVKQRGEKKD